MDSPHQTPLSQMPPPPGPRPRVVGYRTPAWFVPVLVSHVFLLVGVISRLTSSAPSAFQGFFLFAAALNWFSFSFFVGYEIQLTADGVLRWKSPWRRRSVRIEEVTGSKRGFMAAGQRPTIQIQEKLGMTLFARGPGWARFADHVNQVRGEQLLTDFTFHTSKRAAKLAESFFGGGYYEEV